MPRRSRSSWRRDVEMLYYRGIPRKEDVLLHLVLAYRTGLQRGYDIAVSDFFSAEKRNGEPDEDWYENQPTLKRTLGALRRWYK